MAKLVLHVGTHKTGTTSLQDQLHARRADLAERGIIYPDLGRHTGHHGLLTDWISLPAAYNLPGGGKACLRKLADTYRDTDMTVLLSSEEFLRAGGPGGMVDFAEFRRIFGGFDIQVFCVLRHQSAFLPSVYIEVSRSALPARPPQFLAQALDNGQVDGLWCDYARLYAHLRSFFAADEVSLFDYVSLTKSQKGLVGALLSVIAPDAADEIELPGTNWSNRSPMVLPTWAAQVVAGWRVPEPTLRQAAVEAFELEFPNAPTQSLFTAEERATASKVFDQWNTDLAQRLAQDDKFLKLTSPKQSGPVITRTDLTQEYWIRLARRLALNAGWLAA